MLTFFGLMAWQLTVLAFDYTANDRTTSTLEWSVGPIWILVSLIIIACVGVQMWVVAASVSAARKGQPLEHHAESL